MRSHISSLIPRMIRAGLRIHSVRYRIVAAGIDNHNRIISREKHLKNSRDYIKQLREKALLQYGSQCSCCGETEPKFLAFDHINGKGHQHRKEYHPSKFYRWLIENPEAKKVIRILCHNCNMATRWGATCPHQL
jgi:hypothetical protein